MKKMRSLASCFLAIATIMVVFSCKKDLTTKKLPNATDIKAPTDSNFVTLAQATVVAQQAPVSSLVGNAMKTKQIDGTLAASTRQILDYTIYPNAQTTSLYIFNYTGGGFVVVSADKRVEPILAFSGKGHFDVTAQLPDGLSNWLTVNHKNMQLVRSNISIARPKGVTRLWTDLMPVSVNNSGKVIDKEAPPPPPCEPSSTNEQAGPLLQTTWAQGVPYNQYPSMPAGTYYAGGGKAPTGCVATAIAQVLYYWKSPTNYDWADMPLTSDSFTAAGETAVSKLMWDAGASVDMAYGAQESAPNQTYADFYPSYTAIAFKSSLFHYSSATWANWNSSTSYLTVVSNINSREPVLLSGSTTTDGHEWVCDGWLQSTETWCPSGGEPGGSDSYMYFDMNWGWNEAPVTGYVTNPNVDGWYFFDQWEVMNGPDEEYYQYGLNFTYNIHP